MRILSKKKRIPPDWTINEFAKKLRNEKGYLERRFKIREIGAFGSFIHNAQKEDSDLDILVDFNTTPGLFDFMRLEEYIGNLLGVKVDLVMKSALKKHIGKRILEEVIYF